MFRLRELREAKHMSQQKLAIELNITQAAVSKYELGLSEPDITMLKNISDYFHVSIDYLIGFSDVAFQYKISEISADELSLLNDYRRLKEIQKEKVHGYIEGLLQQ